MKPEELEKIIETAIQGNERPFDLFVRATFDRLFPKLYAFTQSKEDCNEIYIISMQKFWERFVIEQKEIPDNIEGYIFMMCKNAWLRDKRGTWEKIKNKSADIEGAENKEIHDLEKAYEPEVVFEEYLKKKALTLALDDLCSKCRQLIEYKLTPKTDFKELQQKLGYVSYNALTQAMYNCKKRLAKKVVEKFVILRETEGNEDQNIAI